MASRQLFGLTARTLALTDVIATQDGAGAVEAGKNTIQEIKDLISPPTVYRALITQASTAAPSAVVVGNTLGGAVTFARSGVGLYSGNSAGNLFSVGLTFLSPKWSTVRSGANYSSVTLTLGTAGQFYITTALNGVAADDILLDFPIEILVYPS